MRSLPGTSIWVEVLQVARLLLLLGVFAAGAGHGRAEEDVDDEHDKEEDAKGDAEVEEPDRRDPTALADV